MKVVVLGAAGNMAPGVIMDLAEGPEVRHITLVDWEWTRDILEERAARWGRGKARVKTANPDDPAQLQTVIRSSYVLANCMIYRYNLQVMEACLAEGVHYVDMGGLFHASRQQMGLSNRWREKDLTAVLGMGSAPGIVNVMSRLAADLLDTVESIHIRDGIVNFTRTESPFPTPYALDTILDEFSMTSFVLEDGKFKEVPPLYGAETVDFPEPVGTQTAYCTLHSEMASIPRIFSSKGLKNMTYKLALPKSFEEKMRFLIALGLGGTEPLKVGTTPVIPREFLTSAAKSLPKVDGPQDDHRILRVDVVGAKDRIQKKIRVEMSCHPYHPWEMSSAVHSVGMPVGVTCRLLGSGVITNRGALPPEACIPPHPFFQELAQRGLPATVTVTHSVT